jgi:hypothetical protein
MGGLMFQPCVCKRVSNRPPVTGCRAEKASQQSTEQSTVAGGAAYCGAWEVVGRIFRSLRRTVMDFHIFVCLGKRIPVTAMSELPLGFSFLVWLHRTAGSRGSGLGLPPAQAFFPPTHPCGLCLDHQPILSSIPIIPFTELMSL